MTVKEMVKKVNAYNELAETFGKEKVELTAYFDNSMKISFTDYKSFKKYVTEEFSTDDLILGYDGFEFNEEVTLTEEKFGYVLETKVVIYAD